MGTMTSAPVRFRASTLLAVLLLGVVLAWHSVALAADFAWDGECDPNSWGACCGPIGQQKTNWNLEPVTQCTLGVAAPWTNDFAYGGPPTLGTFEVRGIVSGGSHVFPAGSSRNASQWASFTGPILIQGGNFSGGSWRFGGTTVLDANNAMNFFGRDFENLGEFWHQSGVLQANLFTNPTPNFRNAGTWSIQLKKHRLATIAQGPNSLFLNSGTLSVQPTTDSSAVDKTQWLEVNLNLTKEGKLLVGALPVELIPPGPSSGGVLSGTVRVEAGGALEFRQRGAGPVKYVVDGAAFEGTGEYRVIGGNLAFRTPASIPRVILNGGTISRDDGGTLDLSTERFDARYGTIRGHANLQGDIAKISTHHFVMDGDMVSVNTPVTIEILDRADFTAGGIQHSGIFAGVSPAGIINRATSIATVRNSTIPSPTDINTFFQIGFENEGTIEKIDSSVVDWRGVSMNNTGIINIRSGNMQFGTLLGGSLNCIDGGVSMTGTCWNDLKSTWFLGNNALECALGARVDGYLSLADAFKVGKAVVTNGGSLAVTEAVISAQPQGFSASASDGPQSLSVAPLALAPAGDADRSAQQLLIDGNYLQTRSGSLFLDVYDGGTMDKLAVINGVAHLSGTLDIDFSKATLVTAGTTYPLGQFPYRSGRFDAVTTHGLPSSLRAGLVYQDRSISLVPVPSGEMPEVSFGPDVLFEGFSGTAKVVLRNRYGYPEIDLSHAALWTSSNPSVAEVSSTGVITSKGVGQTTLTAELNGTTFQKTVRVSAYPQFLDVSRVSRPTVGDEPSADSSSPSLSADGRFVAFVSRSGDLAGDDDNGVEDVFLADRQAGTTRLISRAFNGLPGNGPSSNASISADGKWVVFTSSATDLLPDDGNDADDVFLFSVGDNTIERVSVGDLGQEADRGSQGKAVISPDGRFIGFVSSSSNLTTVPTNSIAQVYLRDRTLRRTRLATRSPAGAAGNADSASRALTMSADGKWLGFTSSATNLVSGSGQAGHFYLYSLAADTLEVGVRTLDGSGVGTDSYATLSGDGRYLLLSTKSAQILPDFPTFDGRFHAFLIDRMTGTATRLVKTVTGSRPSGDSVGLGVSSDGRFSLIASDATNLLPGVTFPTSGFRSYLYDRTTGSLRLVEENNLGLRGDIPSELDSLGSAGFSADNCLVAFATRVGNLVPGDDDLQYDVYLKDLGCGGFPPNTPTPTPTFTPTATATRTVTPTATATPGGSTPPVAASNLKGTGLAGTATLTWTDNSNNETGFRVEQSVNGTTFTTAATVGSNVTTATVGSLATGGTYVFRVVAFNGSGNASPSNTVYVYIAPGPTPTPTPTT